MAKTWLVRSDPFHIGVSGLYATKTAIKLLQEADVVIGVGASLNRYTTEHGYLYPNAKFVHIDTKPHVLMGNCALVRRLHPERREARRRSARRGAREAERSSRPAIARPK